MGQASASARRNFEARTARVYARQAVRQHLVARQDALAVSSVEGLCCSAACFLIGSAMEAGMLGRDECGAGTCNRTALRLLAGIPEQAWYRNRSLSGEDDGAGWK